jgi:bacterial/archaeal transporter family protein
MIAEALALGGSCFGGVAATTTKLGVRHLSPFGFLAVKWGTSGLILTLVVLGTGAWRELQWNSGTVTILLASIIGPVCAWWMYTRSLEMLDVVVAFTISRLSTLWALLLAVIFLGERPNGFTALGAVAIVVGAVLVQRWPEAQANDGTAEAIAAAHRARRAVRTGLLLALATSFAWGVNVVLFKISVDHLGPLQANWVRTAVPGLIWVTAYWRYLSTRAPGAVSHPLTRRGLAFGIATGVLADILDTSLTFTALSMAPVSVVQPLNGSTPLFAALFATLVLHEPINARQILGVCLTVAGIAVVAALGHG